jgi:hypothetical protein
MGSAIWKSWAARMTKPVAVIATDIAFWNPGYGSHRRIEQICQSFSKFFTVKVFVFKTISKRIQSLIDERNYDFEVISYKSYESKFQGKLRTKPEDIHVCPCANGMRIPGKRHSTTSLPRQVLPSW